MVSALRPLDLPAMVRVLSEPKHALVKQYRRFFEMEGADVEFTPEALLEMLPAIAVLSRA